MRKVLVFGNSASGKSTLAKHLAMSEQLAHLDLDLLAWQATNPPTRAPIAESAKTIESFMLKHDSWVIEGCYSDLLKVAEQKSTEIIYMNLPVENCIINAKNRPWESHKYTSKMEQDANLVMLLQWISQYEIRDDNFSKIAHLEFYHRYTGEKKMLTTNA
ncbi:P-loop NTPase family protein [Colwellia psychrerythraea]|nr:shikimate kinase [Colwellia psychrerythraea]